MENSKQDLNEQYMRAALALAREADRQGEVPIGAVVVAWQGSGGTSRGASAEGSREAGAEGSRGRIIARAHNQTELLHDATAHAEMLALTAAAGAVGGKYLDRCTLYVTVEPCPMCAAALSWARIGGLVYGASDSKRGYTTVSTKLLHPKTAVWGGVLEAECAELMTRFFARLRG